MRVGKVWINPGVGEKKLDAEVPSQVRGDEQWRASINRLTLVRINPAIGEEQFDVSAPSVAALGPQKGVPPGASHVNVQAGRVKDHLHGVLVYRIIPPSEGKH